MINKKILLAGLLAIASSCQNSPKENKQNVSDSLKVDTVTQAVHQTVDSVELQIAAQDTLFSDGSIPTSWKNAGFNDATKFKRFMLGFKNWVKTDQLDSITAHIRFPLKTVKSKAEFKQKYSSLFDSSLKKTVEEQRLDRIFRNNNGAMMGNGEIWFIEDRNNYYIIAINK